MAYATYEDVEARLGRTLSADEQAVVSTLLDDAGVIIDTFNANASADAKKIVSCRMVIRAIGTEDGIPLGATQGSMSERHHYQTPNRNKPTISIYWLG